MTPRTCRLPLLGTALAIGLVACAAAIARQQDSPDLALPDYAEGLPVIPSDVLAPNGEIPLLPSRRSPARPETGAAEYLRSVQQTTGQRVAALEARRDELRKELEQVEAELAQWQAIDEAIASVPERFRARSVPTPQPTAERMPFGFDEPALDVPLPPVERNPFELDEPGVPPDAGQPPRPASPFD